MIPFYSQEHCVCCDKQLKNPVRESRLCTNCQEEADAEDALQDLRKTIQVLYDACEDAVGLVRALGGDSTLQREALKFARDRKHI